MAYNKVTGDIGDVTVTIELEGDDEELINLLYADLTGRCDMVKQMEEFDIPADAAQPDVRAQWENRYPVSDEVASGTDRGPEDN